MLASKRVMSRDAALALDLDSRIRLGVLAREKRKDRTAHLKERHAFVDAVPLQAHRLIERGHAVEVVHGDRNDRNARFHHSRPAITRPSIAACACR